ncbi:MAG: PQQ-binding-like beta-propeller repeat protein [Planctomycetes bacterium]|nr:PQQ-binding-like beta-propeller repeat protein [Planctomycetota bacterium]
MTASNLQALLAADGWQRCALGILLMAGPLLGGGIAVAADAPDAEGGHVEVQEIASERGEVYIGGDEEVLRALKRAAALEARQKWSDAAAVYQSIINKQLDDKTTTLVLVRSEPLHGDSYITAAEKCRRQLAKLAPEGARAYLAQYGEAARAALEGALAARDAPALKDVASRYGITESGRQALDAAGDIYFERGGFESAAQTWSAVLDRGGSVAVAVKLAYCYALLGDAARARGLLEALPPDAPADFAGRRRVIAQILDELPGALDRPPPDGWPSIAGNAACSAAPARIIDVGRLMWAYEAYTAAVSEPNFKEYGLKGVPLPRIHYPIVADGRVYLNTGIEVSCLEAATGKLQWRYVADQRRSAARDLIGGGVADGGRFYAMVGGSLVALEAATGKLLWQTTGDTDKLFGGAALISQPAAVRGRVFAGLTRTKGEGESFLIALDAHSGSLVGTVFLESHSQPRHLGLGALGAPPAALGNTIVYCTNLGTVAAVDADSLEVKWLRRYPYAPPVLKAHAIDQALRWAMNPPAIVGGVAVVAPQDAHWLYALDLNDGAVLWRQPRNGALYFSAPSGAGRVFTFGKKVSAVDLATGKLLWTSQPLSGGPAGRPAVGADAFLVPTGQVLHRIDAATGALVGQTAWPEPLEAGNLCIADDMLIVGTPPGVTVFESWQRSQRVLGKTGPWSELGLGKLYLSKGRAERALVCFKRSLRLGGDDLPGLREGIRAAYEMLAQGKLAEDPNAAVQYLLFALQYADDSPEQAGLLMRVGDLAEQLGQHANAVKGYQLVLAEHPDEMCKVGGGLEVRAAIPAQKKIEGLIARHGEEIYAAQEKLAARLLARAELYLVELEKVITRYPNSSSAVRAVEITAESRLEAGFPNEAAGYFQHVADILPRRRRPGILFHAAQRMKAAERPELEAMFLRRLAADHPEAKVGTGGLTAAQYCKAALKEPDEAPGGLFAPPFRERWRSAGRLSSATPRIILGNAGCAAPTPFGERSTFFIAHTDAPRRRLVGMFGQADDYDYLECRTIREGYLVWARGLPGWDGRVEFSDGRLLVARHGVLRALDAATGATAWRYQTEGGKRDFRGIAAVAGDGDRLYLCTTQGKVACLDGRDGGVVWQQQIADAFIFRRALTVVDDSVVVFSEHPAGVYVFDKKTGEVRHEAELNFPRMRITDLPVHVKKRGFFAVPVSDRRIAAIEEKTGKELWRTTAGFAIGGLLAAPSDAYLVVIPDAHATDGKLMVLNTATGRVMWQRDVARDSIFDAAVNSRGVFVLQRLGMEQHLRAFDVAGGKPLFKSYRIAMADLRSMELHGDYVILNGEQAAPRVLVLNRARRRAFAAWPPGAEHLAAAVVGSSLIVATDRGTMCYARTDPAATAHRAAGAAEPESAADLLHAAQRALEMKKLPVAIKLLTSAMAQAQTDADYLRIYDRLAGVRNRLHESTHPVMRCVRMDRPPEIDGILADDWDESACTTLDTPEHVEVMLPGLTPGRDLIAGSDRRGPGRLRSANDLSMKIYAGWDDKNLYLAVDVTDRTHRVTRRDSDHWIGDQLIIGIDCLNDGGYVYGWGDYILSQGLMDKPKEDEGREDEPDGEYSIKLKEDQSGVVYESALPWAYLREIKPEVGRIFGFGVTVTDDDGEGVTKSMSWTPGLYLHTNSSRLGQSFSPELLGDLLLTLPHGYDVKQFKTPEENPEEDPE